MSVFEDRLRDEEATHNVRHLLVRAGSASASETPTQEEYDQAEEEAARLLQEWKSGEATESSFAALVSANSDDTGSAQNGGLISNITPTSSYVEAFLNWSTDPARREGEYKQFPAIVRRSTIKVFEDSKGAFFKKPLWAGHGAAAPYIR